MSSLRQKLTKVFCLLTGPIFMLCGILIITWGDYSGMMTLILGAYFLKYGLTGNLYLFSKGERHGPK